jgi:hypothetical protein
LQIVSHIRGFSTEGDFAQLVSGDWAPLDQVHEHRDHREDEQDVNESAQSVRTDHSQQPKNQEQGDDSPKQRVDLQIRLRRTPAWENPVKY